MDRFKNHTPIKPLSAAAFMKRGGEPSTARAQAPTGARNRVQSAMNNYTPNKFASSAATRRPR